MQHPKRRLIEIPGKGRGLDRCVVLGRVRVRWRGVCLKIVRLKLIGSNKFIVVVVAGCPGHETRRRPT